MARGLILAMAIVIVGGCGRSPVLDSEGLEAAVAENLVPEAPEVVTGIDCPDLIVEGPTELGCVALIGGVPVDVTVVISADDTAAISTESRVVDVTEMEEAAGARLSRDLGVETRVSCPGPAVIVSVPDSTLDCEAVDPSGGVHPVIVTIRSEQGAWDLTLG